MADSDMKKIIGGESFSEFCRKADNNMHRTSKASPEGGEYFPVSIILENMRSLKIVPCSINKSEDYCEFYGWTPVDGHYVSISGRYDNDFANSFLRFDGDY